MPRRKLDVATSKSENEIVQSVDECLQQQGFKKLRSKRKNVWQKGVIWTIFVRVEVSEGNSHIEVWNHAPLPGLGSYIIYFKNRGLLNNIMDSVKKAVDSKSTGNSNDNSEIQIEKSNKTSSKTVSGGVKVWIIFCVIINLVVFSKLIDTMDNAPSSMDNVLTIVIALSGISILGNFMLYRKNHIGLYLIIAAPFILLLMSQVMVGRNILIGLRFNNGNILSNLIIGIITYFITRKQIAYPFEKILKKQKS
jgi:hypothetical protein